MYRCNNEEIRLGKGSSHELVLDTCTIIIASAPYMYITCIFDRIGMATSTNDTYICVQYEEIRLGKGSSNKLVLDTCTMSCKSYYNIATGPILSLIE